MQVLYQPSPDVFHISNAWDQYNYAHKFFSMEREKAPCAVTCPYAKQVWDATVLMW